MSELVKQIKNAVKYAALDGTGDYQKGFNDAITLAWRLVCSAAEDDYYKWNIISGPDSKLPMYEELVLISYGDYGSACVAFYEDGTRHNDDSFWCFSECGEWMEYDSEADDYIIPKGWYSYNPFADSYGVVDKKVNAWRMIETPERDWL